MLLGDIECRVSIVLRPPPADGDDGLAISADRPVGCPLPEKEVAVHVLVHVEECVDAVSTEKVDRLGDIGQVAASDRGLELVRISR